MTELAQTLNRVINARRLEILSFLSQAVNNTVQTGPFKGMIIVPKASWGDGDTGAKWLGIYEDELHNSVEDAISKNPDCVINIGCAEGYYIVGICKRLPNTTGIAIDVSRSAVTITNENAEANGISVKTLCEEIDTAWLEENCSKYKNPLLVVDCESAELALLNPTAVPSLSSASIIVECHDCMVAGITDELTNRFNGTHNIEVIDQKFKDPYQFEFLKQFSDADKWALVTEGRPSAMTWLYMTPKTL